MQKSLKKYFPIFVLPTLIAFCIAFLIPFIMGIYLSFTKFNTVTDAKFIGVKNYVRAFQNADFTGSSHSHRDPYTHRRGCTVSAL